MRDLAEVVHDVDRVEAGSLGGRGHVAQPATHRACAAGRRELPEVQAYARAGHRPRDGVGCAHPRGRPDEGGGDHPHRLGRDDVVEPLPGQRGADRRPGPQLRGQHVDRDALGPVPVAFPADGGGGVEGDCDAGDAGARGHRAPGRPSVGVEAEGVDDRGQATADPQADDLVEESQRVRARGDVVLTGADDRAQPVAAHHRVGREVLGRPGGLARGAGPDEDDEARSREPEHVSPRCGSRSASPARPCGRRCTAGRGTAARRPAGPRAPRRRRDLSGR